MVQHLEVMGRGALPGFQPAGRLLGYEGLATCGAPGPLVLSCCPRQRRVPAQTLQDRVAASSVLGKVLPTAVFYPATGSSEDG